MPHLLLWGGCPRKLGLGELGGLAEWRGLSRRSGKVFLKVGRRSQYLEKLGLGELGGLAGWRVETRRRIFYQMALPGAFSQIPDPTNSGPVWSAGGA